MKVKNLTETRRKNLFENMKSLINNQFVHDIRQKMHKDNACKMNKKKDANTMLVLAASLKPYSVTKTVLPTFLGCRLSQHSGIYFKLKQQ